MSPGTGTSTTKMPMSCAISSPVTIGCSTRMRMEDHTEWPSTGAGIGPNPPRRRRPLRHRARGRTVEPRLLLRREERGGAQGKFRGRTRVRSDLARISHRCASGDGDRIRRRRWTVGSRKARWQTASHACAPFPALHGPLPRAPGGIGGSSHPAILRDGDGVLPVQAEPPDRPDLPVAEGTAEAPRPRVVRPRFEPDEPDPRRERRSLQPAHEGAADSCAAMPPVHREQEQVRLVPAVLHDAEAREHGAFAGDDDDRGMPYAGQRPCLRPPPDEPLLDALPRRPGDRPGVAGAGKPDPVVERLASHGRLRFPFRASRARRSGTPCGSPTPATRRRSCARPNARAGAAPSRRARSGSRCCSRR